MKKDFEISYMIFFLSGIVLGCIDILIKKIPTELLILYTVLLLLQVVPGGITISGTAFALIIGAGFFALRRKLGIGLYDIILLTMLMLSLNGFEAQMKFIALFLLMWGTAGAILRYIIKQEGSNSIPLVPFIMLSYYFQLFMMR